MKNKRELIIVFILFSLLIVFIAWYIKQQKPPLETKMTPIAQVETIKEITLTSEQLQQYYLTYRDPYVIALRTAINGYLDGTNKGMDSPQIVIESSQRDGYIDGLSSFSREYYKSKFIVYVIENSAAGGKDMAIIFQDKPDKLFRAWVYKLSTGSYDLRGFSQDLRYTPEKMKVIQKQYKTLLIDKAHAI